MIFISPACTHVNWRVFVQQLNSNLDQDLMDFVMPSARRWHGERIVVLIAFMVYGFNNSGYQNFNIKVAER